jgi:hypothetical protein
MENKGLLFIPDISGFTRFVNETEIEHSRLIIEELLEVLINANEIGLEISEIEGDAILFYKFGEPPALEELYRQVEKMFCAFHQNLIAYDHRRYCQCKACMSAVDLSLKVITHYGEFTGYNVRNFNKLIGRDIIVAHQLLKNDIELHEYWLVSKGLLRDQPPAGFAQWMNWVESAKQTESGKIPFHYTLLSQLKTKIDPEPYPQQDLSKKIKMISASKEYETDIITLFHATGDFSFRSRWQKGVVKVEELNHFLPRVGMRCRSLLENGESITYSSSYTYQPDRIEFTETDERKKNVTRFLLEKTGDHTTRLTLEYYIAKNPVGQIVFKLLQKKKKENDIYQSLQKLTGLVKEIKLPAEA